MNCGQPAGQPENPGIWIGAAAAWQDLRGVCGVAGTFSNIPRRGIVNVNGNNLQADYEGGDGNDLTLTVVP